MIPIFNVVLISDKDENAINNGKHVVLFLLSKYSDKLYGNIVYRTQMEMSNFIQVQALLVFQCRSEGLCPPQKKFCQAAKVFSCCCPSILLERQQNSC